MQTQLGLGRFLGALAVDHKPRLLYRFLLTKGSPVAVPGSQVVLKVYGDRPRGEGPLQQAWRARGLDVPRLVCGEAGDCSWLLMEHLELRPAATVLTDQLALVDQLANMGRTMHRPIRDVESLLRPLDEVMVPRWKEAVASLLGSGQNVPSSWLGRAAAAYASGRGVPLHGDMAPANLGKSRSGRLIVFDASALQGAASFDAARWSARAGPGGVGPEALLRRWISVENLPSDREPWDLLAAECVLEAGSREIVRSRGSLGSLRLPQGVAAAGVSELLTVASKQWF
ncbi:fructosamine kinase family protein [Pseudarthrobacter sp. ATCC 49987]|uniref:fructosamine kinase family protein n=1 Tax=Pseudarthrobacter sp. ATCC 49987 TaxID=2698204 RepID=UPI00136FDBA4|nr:fructosamine kinase family protein [Pseudarthrobacter sp. ATCC 49987]